jgi:aspartokinase/homoserine dehydrogenase 1
VGIPIQIHDVHNPQMAGSVISAEADVASPTIKSVTCMGGLSLLKVHSASIGIKPRLLSSMISAVAERDIQILGVSTSQACFGVVLRTKDLGSAVDAIQTAKMPELEGIDSMEGLALVGAVGTKALEEPTVIPRMLSAVASVGSSVTTVAAGASSAAVYFVVEEAVVQRAVEIVHATFCEDN